MSDEIKRIDIKEFRAKGFLQEANRLFFHPLGLALEVVIDKETGEEHLGGVWDYRDSPEGVLFHDSMLTEEFKAKAERIAKLFEKKQKSREEVLGFFIQPIE